MQLPARGTNRAFTLIRQRSLSPIITNVDRISAYAAVRPFFAGIRQICWYRKSAGIAIFGGIEPMPVKNDTYFRHLKPGEKDYKRSDSGGLFMLVTATGSKLWRFGYRFDAKQKLLALGQYPVTSLADARIKRDDAKKLLAEGIDPSADRKEERRNARIARANTFEAVAKELMDKFEAEGDAPTTLKKKHWLLDFANKEFGKRPIAEIKAPEILDALKTIDPTVRRTRYCDLKHEIAFPFLAAPAQIK